MKKQGNKKKVRIAMFGHKRIPSREGGIEVVVTELATRIARKGYKVTCFNRWGSCEGDTVKDRRHFHSYEGVKVHPVLTVNKTGLAAVSSSFSAAVCAALGPYDVVHVHAEGPAFWCFILKLFRKRVIVTIHGLDHQRAKWGRFGSWFIYHGEKHAVRFADEIIVLNDSGKKYFKETYNRDTVVIPNAVNPPQYAECKEISEKFGLEKQEYILSLGRLVPEKGIHVMIEAFKKVKTDKKLVIAGSAIGTQAYLDSLKELAAGDDRIIFTGYADGRVLHELFSNPYFFLMASELEGMPIALLEAMSYGNACLVSDIPECALMVKDHGAVFQVNDVDALSKQMQALCDNPDRVAVYRERTAEHCKEYYNWDGIVDKTLALYERR